MTDRETATVLAGLRSIQGRMRPPFLCGNSDDARRAKYIKESFPEQFLDVEPLSDEEIDDLCEKLNAPDTHDQKEYKALLTNLRVWASSLQKTNYAAFSGIQTLAFHLEQFKVEIPRITAMPCVGIFLEGGLVRGIRSNTTTIETFVYDADNEEFGLEDYEAEQANLLERYEALPHGIY